MVTTPTLMADALSFQDFFASRKQPAIAKHQYLPKAPKRIRLLPRPPGGNQQVLPNVLAGFERTEAGVAAEGSNCAGRSPAQLGSENLSTASLRRAGCFPAEPYRGVVKQTA
jgi:hypothetical protein